MRLLNAIEYGVVAATKRLSASRLPRDAQVWQLVPVPQLGVPERQQQPEPSVEPQPLEQLALDRLPCCSLPDVHVTFPSVFVHEP